MPFTQGVPFLWDHKWIIQLVLESIQGTVLDVCMSVKHTLNPPLCWQSQVQLQVLEMLIFVHMKKTKTKQNKDLS